MQSDEGLHNPLHIPLGHHHWLIAQWTTYILFTFFPKTQHDAWYVEILNIEFNTYL